MSNRHSALPDEFQRLLDLIQQGKLFALQDWIKAGKRLRASEDPEADPHALRAAVCTGFHSLVEELLRAGGWSQAQLTYALELARSRKCYHIADLLPNYGARPKQVDFETACDELDLPMMERHLNAGVDLNQDNVFAQALCFKKARPLLRFYKQFRTEFPALDDQAALALCEAVKRTQVRWTALLAWAGADPFRPVPTGLSEPFPVDPENCTNAAEEAVWRNHPDTLKVLRLKPTPAQALRLLADASRFGNLKLFQNLLSMIPRDQINNTPRGSCDALERVVARWAHRAIFGNDEGGKADAENLQCLELLLDAGARWDPPPEDFRHARRGLLKHEPRYIVQLLRLLLYTPNAVNLQALLELCRSQTLEARIATEDAPLVQEIKQLRKCKPPG